MASADGSPVLSFIVYDGACPFCSAYVRLLRLRESTGPVELVSARDSQHPVVCSLKASGYDLNEGMAFVQDDRIYHGEECMTRLALLSSSSGFFNRMNAAIFRSATLSKILYPVLRFGRNVALRLLGRKDIA